MTATVAGTAPPSRTACSNSRASTALSGRGRPWLMIVLSSATTARPSARASATSACTCTGVLRVSASAAHGPVERASYQLECLILPDAQRSHHVGIAGPRLLGRAVDPVAVHDRAVATPRRDDSRVLQLPIGAGDGVHRDAESGGERTDCRQLGAGLQLTGGHL